MRKCASIGAGFAAIMFSTASVFAADVEPVAQSYDWSGAYIGLHAGYLWAKVDYDEPDFPDSSLNRKDEAFIGGLYLGYNHQMDSLVAGIEGDFGLGGIDIDNNEDAFFNSYTAFESDWNAHIRARLGFAMDRVLVYLAGGLAIADLEIDDTDDGYGKVTNTHLGWTIGGGIEYAVSENLLVRAEYLYDDYGREGGEISGPNPAADYDVDADMSASTVRLGIAYIFSGE